MWLYFLGGLIASLFLCGAIWLTVYLIGKFNCLYKTKHGISVYCNENLYARNLKKKELENFIDAFLEGLAENKLIEKATSLKILKGKTLRWFPLPFYTNDDGWVYGKASLAGAKVGFSPDLHKTALAHELMHVILLNRFGDASHNPTYFDFVSEFQDFWRAPK